MNKEEFLKNLNQFHLGQLTTESFHPTTKKLSQTLNANVKEGLELFKKVDLQVLNKFQNYIPQIYALSCAIKKTLETGNKIFISGCGATGRLALLIEKQFRDLENSPQVIGFMAGGDFALIKSVESFEDKSEYGSRQLMDLGFTKNDLLLGVTEGGETSFVLGTLEKAQALGAKAFFLYCNPDHDLVNIQRSASILNNPNITNFCLTVGAMALSGSTRMQATTVQLLAITLALYQRDLGESDFTVNALKIIKSLSNLDYDKLEFFIKRESDLYDQGEIITYKSSHELALSILTDTTERSPTFSLPSFESMRDSHQALCFLSIKETNNAKEAWFKMLGHREPRAIEWNEVKLPIGLDDIYSFDISESAIKRRSSNIFEIKVSALGFEFCINDDSENLETHGLNEPYSQIALKLYLNTLSTSIMGLQNRYIGNMMSFVKPSNMKLIDRATRYSQNLLEDEGIKVDYLKIVDVLFEKLDSLKPNESIVLKVCDYFKN